MNVIVRILLICLFIFTTACGIKQGNETENGRGKATDRTQTETVHKEKRENKAKLKTNVSELEKLIHLPYKPKKVLYTTNKIGDQDENREETLPGPSEYEVLAFLEFDEKTIEEIKQKVLNTKPVNKSMKVSNSMIEKWYSPEMQKDIKSKNKAIIKDWYPESLKKKIKEDEKTGYIFTGYYYSPDIFAKEPFKNGYLYFAPGNTILVYFSTSL